MVEDNGGVVKELLGVEQFENLFSKGNEGCCVQILSHFHYDRFFTKDLSTVTLRSIFKTLSRMKENDVLRDDIAIDAITCNNYDSLTKLYDVGIRYIFSSRHNLDSTLAAFMFYELYSGENAKILNWNFPYLNGNSYLHEAWSNVVRCFYTMTSIYSSIRVP